jgi:hypothetical protein
MPARIRTPWGMRIAPDTTKVKSRAVFAAPDDSSGFRRRLSGPTP